MSADLGGRRSATSVAVEAVTEATEELREALNELLSQLTPGVTPPDPELLSRVVADPAVTLYVARAEGGIVGTLTLAVHATPGRVKAYIEDVVVAEAARGRGAGEALVTAALEEARRRGASVARLTSANHRAAAHRLYQRLGFTTVETTAFRKDL